MKPSLHHCAVCVAAMVLGLCVVTGLAQDSSARTVRGQVLDENEKPVERAVVHLTNLATKKRLSVATDKDGRYQFGDLSRKDDFELVAELGERRSRTRKLSQFDARPLVFVHLKLEPAKEKEDAGASKEKKDEDD